MAVFGVVIGRWLVWSLAILLMAAACRTSDQGGFSMGGEALGGSATTELLAQQLLESAPPERAAWIAHEISLPAGETLDHRHEFAFAYAVRGEHRLTVDGVGEVLEEGGSAVVPAGASHRHEGAGLFWEIRLASSGSDAPAEGGRLVFESEPLEGVPPDPLAVFVEVRLPPGGQTSVHTHPGPELVYQLSGTIEYENSLIGAIQMGPGGLEGIPPGKSVQKRNPSDEEAVFLSWFLVDPDQAFASPAAFGPPGVEGENVALGEKGARVIGVSSNFGGGPNDSQFGAEHAIDGDPATEWSSDGDGDDAWIEIGLDRSYRVIALSAHTRTMGESARVASFSVLTDDGTELGPFELPGADRPYLFPVDVEAQRLRFQVLSSSGGNTGFVDLGVFVER
ncbi:MAG: cupin domain-containing protein [Acidimicrobiia bacterium]